MWISITRCPEPCRCDGAILVVDAAQGIEAQTLANVYLALDHDLDVFPVINKVDLPSADPDRVAAEIEDVIGLEAHDAPRISAKTGLNIDQVLEQIVEKIPAPTGDPEAPLQALIFDSLYDSYRGVIVFCRIKNGTVKKGTPIKMMATGATAEVVEVGYFGAGQFIACDEAVCGNGRLHYRQHQERPGYPGRRYDHKPRKSLPQPSSRL